MKRRRFWAESRCATGRFLIGPSSARTTKRPGWTSSARGAGAGWAATMPTSSKPPGPGRWAPSTAWPSPTARVRSITSLAALGVGPGDEVIVPPYTFVATVNAVLMHHALPIFVDTDPETFQIDARKIEAAITERTRCIIPVHLGGAAADLDAIAAVAAKHKIPVLEDACQAHLAEWRGRKVSTLGDLGCFSFQGSKNLNSGEGGAILTSSDELIEQCKSFQNNGRGTSTAGFSYVRNGANLRMTEFQAALLLQQLTRLEEQSRRREQNAAYLTGLLREIPGIAPARMYDGCTRNAYHLIHVPL